MKICVELRRGDMLCTRVSSEAQSGSYSESATENLECTGGRIASSSTSSSLDVGRENGRRVGWARWRPYLVPLVPFVPLQLGHLVIPTKAKSAIMQRFGKVHT